MRFLWKKLLSFLLVLGLKWMSLPNVVQTSNNLNRETDK